MPLLGQAAVAMWWTMASEHRDEFQDWHSHEHFPERMRIPGFLRGSRWASRANEDGFFVIYELDAYATLTSPHYRERLDNPTPWSTKMMPHHRGMVRSQARVAASFGGGIAAAMLTLRVSPQDDIEAAALRKHLAATLRDLPAMPGLTGAHLLITDTPRAEATTEQKIRGGDAAADWIVLVSGYEPAALDAVAHGALSSDALTRAGAAPEMIGGRYTLAYALAKSDLTPSTRET